MNENISIILSTYNEKPSIKFTINSIIKNLNGAEIIVVDDNSPDGTLEIIKAIDYQKLKVFSRKNTKGLATAFLLGLINSTGKHIGWLDSNMGSLAEKFPEMLKKLDSNEEYLGPNPEKYFKKGGSVKVKCKLGRNRPTKMY